MNQKDLKAWRVRLGLSQAQAAELLGVDDRTYQRYEHGTIFGHTVPRTIAGAAFGASQAFREVLPIVPGRASSAIRGTARRTVQPLCGTSRVIITPIMRWRSTWPSCS
jgi:transcriptional regulator with XRE-family HTH domain